MATLDNHPTQAGRFSWRFIGALVIAGGLCLGAALALLVYGPRTPEPVLTAAAIVAGAVAFAVVNLWDAQDTARFERKIAEDEDLIHESRKLAARFNSED